MERTLHDGVHFSSTLSTEEVPRRRGTHWPCHASQRTEKMLLTIPRLQALFRLAVLWMERTLHHRDHFQSILWMEKMSLTTPLLPDHSHLVAGSILRALHLHWKEETLEHHTSWSQSTRKPPTHRLQDLSPSTPWTEEIHWKRGTRYRASPLMEKR